MKKSIKVLALFAIVICFAFALPEKEKNKKQFTVLIDVAHGGKDNGAVYENYLEKNISLQIASKLKEVNKDKDITIHLVRDEDKFVTLEERVTAINTLKPDLVLSLHLNMTNNAEKNGMEFYISDKSSAYKKSEEYANKLADHFNENKFVIGGGVRTAGMYILKNSESPAILCELGFLSNEKEREYLTNEKNHEEIATILLDFIKEIK